MPIQQPARAQFQSEAFTGLRSGALAVRRLTDTPHDIGHMARWLSDPRVLEFYEGRDRPHDEQKVREVFIAGMRDSQEVPCIIEWEGRPLGYIQFYPIPADEAAFGMDQFIGEPDWWGRGVGTQVIRLVMGYLFRECGARRVLMDPVISNARAIRAYEKCGFRKVRLLPAHELHEGVAKDAWLMVATPETVDAVAWPHMPRPGSVRK